LAVVPGHPGRGHRPYLLLPALQLWLPAAPLGQLLDPKPLLRSCSCRPLIRASMYVYCVAPTRGCLCCHRLNGRKCGLWGQVLHVPSAPVYSPLLASMLPHP
jgi:hypothetical protein